jgi:hypothetical protein
LLPVCLSGLQLKFCRELLILLASSESLVLLWPAIAYCQMVSHHTWCFFDALDCCAGSEFVSAVLNSYSDVVVGAHLVFHRS